MANDSLGLEYPYKRGAAGVKLDNYASRMQFVCYCIGAQPEGEQPATLEHNSVIIPKLLCRIYVCSTRRASVCGV